MNYKSKSHRPQTNLFQLNVSNIDDIAVLSDEDLMTQISILDEQRQQVGEEKSDLRPWDEELCYYRREVQIRRKRRELHEQFLLELEKEIKEAQEYEKTLPIADLDNSQFIFFN